MEKWETLYQMPRVKEWIESYQSKDTHEFYLKSIYLMGEEGLDPEAFLGLEPVEARNRVWEIIKRLIDRGQNHYGNGIKYASKSLYNHHHEDTPLNWNRRIHRVPNPLKKASVKEIPTHDQVWRMVDSAKSIRDKAIIALMYNSGLGHQAICNLNYGDVIKTLEKGSLPYEVVVDSRVYPKRFRVNTGATFYIVFFDKDCGELLKLHLRDSQELREYSSKLLKVPMERTPLFLTTSNTATKGRRMRRWDVWWVVKEIIRKHGETMDLYRGQTWSYLLRDSFFNRLIEGGVKDIHREYLMGHSLGVRGNYYRANSRDLKEQYLASNFNRVEPIEESIEGSEVVTDLKHKLNSLEKQLQRNQIILMGMARAFQERQEPLPKEIEEALSRVNKEELWRKILGDMPDMASFEIEPKKTKKPRVRT